MTGDFFTSLGIAWQNDITSDFSRTYLYMILLSGTFSVVDHGCPPFGKSLINEQMFFCKTKKLLHEFIKDHCKIRKTEDHCKICKIRKTEDHCKFEKQKSSVYILAHNVE